MKNRWLESLFPLDVWKITLIALGVRVLTATWTGLTTDEAFAVALASVRSWVEFLAHLQHDPNPPLFYGLLCAFATVFGAGPLAFKILMIVLATAVVPLTYAICRTFLTREQSSQVALLLALCPPVVRFSTLIRSYALMPLLSLLSTWAFMRVMTVRDSKLWPVLYGVFTVLLVYCHYWGGFVAIGQACAVVFGLAKGWYARSDVVRWLAGVALSLLLFLPWLPTLHYQMTHNVSPWAAPPGITMLVMLAFPYVLTGDVDAFSRAGQGAIFLCNLLAWLVIVCPQALVRYEGDGDESAVTNGVARKTGRVVFDGRQWKLVAVCSILAAFFVSFIKPVMRDRYFTPFTPLFLIVFVTTFHKLFPRLPLALRYLVPIAVWLPIWLPQLYVLHRYPETNTPAVIKVLKEGVDRDKDLVVITWQAIAPAIVFYLPADMRATSFPALVRTCFTEWDGMDARMRSQENLDKLFSTMKDTLSAGGSIWLIDAARGIQETDYKDDDEIQELLYGVADFRRQDQIRTWLSDHSFQKGDNTLAPGRDFSIFLSEHRPLSQEHEKQETLQEPPRGDSDKPPP